MYRSPIGFANEECAGLGPLSIAGTNESDEAKDAGLPPPRCPDLLECDGLPSLFPGPQLDTAPRGDRQFPALILFSRVHHVFTPNV